MRRGACWFYPIPGSGPCEGRLVRCHLIPKQLFRQHFPRGAYFHDGQWVEAGQAHARLDLPPLATLPYRTRRALQDDPRASVYGCGGMVGLGGHHGAYDGHKLRVSYSRLPPGARQYARELGLDWWLRKHHS